MNPRNQTELRGNIPILTRGQGATVLPVGHRVVVAKKCKEKRGRNPGKVLRAGREGGAKGAASSNANLNPGARSKEKRVIYVPCRDIGRARGQNEAKHQSARGACSASLTEERSWQEWRVQRGG